MIQSINPTSGDVISEYEQHSADQVEAALAAATSAQKKWRKVPIAERVNLLSAMAKELRAGQDKFAHLITQEMGKPVVEAAAEIE